MVTVVNDIFFRLNDLFQHFYLGRQWDGFMPIINDGLMTFKKATAQLMTIQLKNGYYVIS